METFCKPLDGKITLVTGGSRGIGRAAALALAKAGTLVAVNYKTHTQAAEAVCREIQDQGGRAQPVQANVSIATQVAEGRNPSPDELSLPA